MRRPSSRAHQVSKFTTFPIARYFHSPILDYYNAYDKVPVKDYLESCSGEQKPSILLLKCGDILSCCYTIWKNLDHTISNAPKRFHGVEFTLNDHSAAVQARNIVFLHLCFELPETELERKKWLSAMWAIWYCHELHSYHQTYLDASLRFLLKFSTSLKKWTCKENPMNHLVKFTSSTCLSNIAQVWKIWYEKEVAVSSVEQMHKSRKTKLVQSDIIEKLERYSFEYAWIALYMRQLTTKNLLTDLALQNTNIATRQGEVKSYITTGNCFTENAFGIAIKENSQTSVNLTLYNKQDGNYCLQCKSIPYNRYHQTIKFSYNSLKSKDNIHCFKDFNVLTKKFESAPFLANSVQQFSLWVQSTHRVLMNKNTSISFLFSTQDSLTFCQELQLTLKRNDGSEVQKVPMYDVIATSDLIDQLGPPNIVLSTLPLLKDEGLLFTTTWLYKRFYNTVEEYLKAYFGFDSQIFPVILGVRCVNHEGIQFASSILITPTPPSLADLIKTASHQRELTWQKVSGVQKLMLPTLPPINDGGISAALLNLVMSNIFMFHGSGNNFMPNRMNTESSIMILVRFISVSCNVTLSNYAFWEPLCEALVDTSRPYIHSLQTQMLLHNIHAHLTATERDCPLCKQIPLENSMVLLCTEVPLNSQQKLNAEHFMAIIHKTSYSDTNYLLKQAYESDGIHLFDCLDGVVSNEMLQIRLFVPQQLVQQNYKILVVQVLSRCDDDNRVIMTDIPSQFLTDLQPSSVKYDFIKPCYSSIIHKSDFGVISSHFCDENSSETKVTLNKSAIRKLLTDNICHKRLSACEIEISCRTLSLKLKYCYPIHYNSLQINTSTKDGEMYISCFRQIHVFEEESAGFIVSPDHHLSLPPFKLNKAMVESHASGQYAYPEMDMSKNMEKPLLSFIYPVKLILQSIFEGCSNSISYFLLVNLSQNENLGYIIVNKVLFDCERRTPAIDLAFCILKNHANSDEVSKKWKKIVHPIKVVDVIKLLITDAGLEILDNVLQYFVKQTNGSLLSAGSNSRYHVLRSLNVSHLFSRAVVYLLLLNPDTFFKEVGNFYFHKPTVTLSSEFKKCDFCQQLSANKELCYGCKKVNYCSKRCQSKHWAEHHTNCIPENSSGPSKNVVPRALQEKINNPSLKETDTLQKACAHCKKTPDSLIKCTKCGAVEYCNEECQTNHLPEHDKICIQDCATDMIVKFI